MAFTLPDLPYAHDALAAAGMSKETMEYHHDIHHKAYVDNLNKMIAGTEWEGKTLVEIVKGTFKEGAVAQSGIFNNASQHWNHAQFWEMMAPKPGKMPGDLEKAIKDSFGSVDDFKAKFKEAGVGQFGSGWVWLVVNAGKLEIVSTANQDNPLMGKAIAGSEGTPILGLDVWEHAYYLKYQNRRPDYVGAWWNVVNWAKVGELFACAAK